MAEVCAAGLPFHQPLLPSFTALLAECFICVTAVGKGTTLHAADTVTDNLQPSESHGAEWNSSQTLQHRGSQDN